MQTDDLRERLRELAAASADRKPSADVERRVLLAFAAAPPRQVAAAPTRAAWRVMATAATLLIGATFVLVLETTRISPAPPPASGPDDAAGSDQALDDFIPVPGAGSLPDLESASIVRYELPVFALPAYGIELMPDAGRPSILADLLIGQDGQPRAIRLVNDPATARSTP